MRPKALLVATAAAVLLGFSPVLAQQEEEQQEKRTPKYDIKARILYDQMIQAMRKAKTLSFESRYRWTGKEGREIGRCVYSMKMKKPNYFLLETTRRDGSKGGTIVGDGDYLWLYWPHERPFFSTEDPKNRHKDRTKRYMKEWAANGMHSIGHRTGRLGANMSMTIIDPSTFHGYTDSLQPYLDGVTSMGTETIDEEECNVILVSFMKGQRTWK
ncbi:MAG: LolA family protein, partial [Planctomycetota bacterium]